MNYGLQMSISKETSKKIAEQMVQKQSSSAKKAFLQECIRTGSKVKRSQLYIHA